MTDTVKQAAASVEATTKKDAGVVAQDFDALKAWVVKHVLEGGEHLFEEVMTEAHKLTGSKPAAQPVKSTVAPAASTAATAANSSTAATGTGTAAPAANAASGTTTAANPGTGTATKTS